MQAIKSIVFLGGISLFLVGSAAAADLPGGSPYKAPPVVYAPAFTWTGFYAGLNAGWGSSTGDGTITMATGSGPISGSGNGFLGGGQLGYNWQMGSIVVGAEADFQGSSGKGDLNGNAGTTSITGSLKTPWFGTFRGRLGYAMDRWLLYVTGGGVYGKNTYEGTLTPGGAFSSSANFWSWTAGLGVEAMVWDRWSAKVEYLYGGKPSEFPVPPGTTDLTGDLHSNIIRAGLNYHF